jgi:hypothetical protein
VILELGDCSGGGGITTPYPEKSSMLRNIGPRTWMNSLERPTGNVKLSLCLPKQNAMKTYWGGGIAPRILDLGTKKEVSGQTHAPVVLIPGKEAPIPTG